MGIKASNTTEVYFEDVKVPKANLLGSRSSYASYWDGYLYVKVTLVLHSWY